MIAAEKNLGDSEFGVTYARVAGVDKALKTSAGTELCTTVITVTTVLMATLQQPRLETCFV